MLHDWTFWFFVVCMFSGVSILLGIRRYAARKSDQSAEEFSARFGFRRVHPEDILRDVDPGQIEILNRGVRRRITDAWEGMYSGETYQLFTISYSFGLPLLASARYSQTVVALKQRIQSTPVFAMAPKRHMDRSISTLRWTEVDELREIWSGRNWMISPAAEEVKRLLQAGVFHFLQRNPQHSQYTIESGGGWLLLFEKNKFVLADAWQERMSLALHLSDAMRDAASRAR